MFRYLLGFILLAIPFTANAYDEDVPLELRSFQGLSLPIDDIDEARTTPRITRQQDIIPYIQSSISKTASYIITNPEQVFCYRVAKRPKDYTGYTLDNTAITGYCNELNEDQITTIYEALFTQSPNILTQQSDCSISPRVMLRFVRGVDNVDILLSLPCPSFTVFYGGKYKSFNVIQEVMMDIIRRTEKEEHPFHSPALIKQTVANAVAANTKDEETLEKKQHETEKAMNFLKQNSADKDNKKTNTSGWGNINLKMRQKNQPE